MRTINKTKILILLIVLVSFGFRNLSAQTPQECTSQGTATILAPWYCSQINQATATIWTQWAPVVLIAIVFSFSLAAVIYMMSVVFKSQGMRSFAIGEIYEAIATVIIAGLFLSLAAIMFGIIPSFVTGPVNPYLTSLSYINSTIGTTDATLTALFNVMILDYFYNTVSISASVASEGVTESQQSTGSQVNNIGSILSRGSFLIYALFIFPASSISILLIDGLLVLNTEFYLILFMMYVAIPVFLIPGIVFRSIFPLRSLGGIMVAMAIGFYLIMPLLFSVSYYFTSTNLISTLNTYAQQITVNGAGTGAQTNAESATAPLVTEVTGLQNSMGSYWLSILFYPALIIAITYESIRTIAEFIGGAVKTTSRLSLRGV